MQKNQKISNPKKIAFIIICVAFFLPGYFCGAVNNPNYGTTTFFSGKTEKPVLEKPILGAKDEPEKGDEDEDDKDDDVKDGDSGGGGIINPNDIFNKIGDTVNSVVDSSLNAYSDVKDSLFDKQSDFGSESLSSDDEFDKKDEFFIAGPRGESPEYMASLNENRKPTIEFNFEDRNLKVAPAKSKLLFTNKEVAVDMTAQYVSFFFIVFIALGSAVGYYYVKKGALSSKEENYD